MKRLIQILGALLVFGIVVAGGYYLLSGNGGVAPADNAAADDFGLPQTPVLPGGAPENMPSGGNLSAGAAFGTVTDFPVVGFFVDSQNTVTAVATDGRIMRVSGGVSSTLSDAPVTEIAGALFSFDGKKVLVGFGSPANRSYSIFDTTIKTWQPLPSGVASPTWSPSDLRLAFFSVGATVTNLSTLDTSNPKALPKTIISLRVQDVRLEWPRPERMLLIERGASAIRSSAYALNPATKSVTLLVDDFPGLLLRWNGVVDRGAFFSAGAGERGGYLSIVDGAGVITGLTLTTFPEKCAFFVPQTTSSTTGTKTIPGGTTLVCGVPKNYPQLRNQPLPDSYEKRAVFALDDFYSVDVTTGALAPVFVQDAYALDADRVVIFGTKLFFVNRFDDKVYAIELKK